MEIISEESFYKDVIFHSEFGKMINSGPLSGTPGSEAKRKNYPLVREQGLW